MEDKGCKKKHLWHSCHLLRNCHSQGGGNWIDQRATDLPILKTIDHRATFSMNDSGLVSLILITSLPHNCNIIEIPVISLLESSSNNHKIN